MKIETSERVVYEHNPLAEVVCQVRFEKLGDLDDGETAALQAEFAAVGYPNFSEEVSFGFAQQFGPNGVAAQAPVALPQTRIRHFSSADGVWRVSVCSEFVALTCLKYSSWGEFRPRFISVSQAFLRKHPEAKPSRLGLRYKDVVEREPLGLDGVQWHELIAPFLLGPLAPNTLATGHTPTDDDVGNFLSQTLLRLDDAMLLLQSSLLASLDGQRRAFLIDADFYNEGDLEPDLLTKPEVLTARLESLHASAGALFRRGITERLHRALRPNP